jgi:DNA mismatch repair ATPase MutS
VNPKFEPKLEHLHKQKAALRDKIKKHDKEVQDHLGVDSLKREKDKSFLFVYKVNKKGEPAVSKAEKDGYSILLSTKTGVKFRTPELKQFCEKLQL